VHPFGLRICSNTKCNYPIRRQPEVPKQDEPQSANYNNQALNGGIKFYISGTFKAFDVNYVNCMHANQAIHLPSTSSEIKTSK